MIFGRTFRYFLFFFALVAFANACQSNAQETEQVLRVFPVTTPIVIDTMYYTDYVADIHSLKNVEVRARVKGYVEQIHIDEGKRVQKGQVLFSISSQQYKEEVLKAKAALKSSIAEAKSAEVNLGNVKLLVEKNTVAKSEQEIAQANLDALLAKIDEAKAHLATTELQLAFTEIRAPFDGIIDRIPFKIGSLIDEGSLLTTISDNTEVYAYFNVSEKEYFDFLQNTEQYANRNEITLLLANNSEHKYKGVMETVEGEFDQKVGSIAFRVRFQNPELVLKHGASGKIRIARTLKQVLVIPQKASFAIQDRNYVYVVNKDNQVRMQSFTSKLSIPHLYIVASGLSAQDRIVYEGIQDLQDGLKIDAKMIKMSQIIEELAKR